MQGVFITGTGTGAGKTFVASEIARQLNQRNINVIPRKPVESGCIKQGDELIPQDAIALKNAANYPGPLSEVCPYRFEPAISPERAARIANKTLTTEQLAQACLHDIEGDFVLVEGAGGFYSPLAEDGLNADLAVALQLPVLLIADDRLGALSQVLLTVEAIQTRELQLSGVVLNNLDDSKNEHMDNSADLRQRLDCPVFTIPYIKDGIAELPDALIDALLTPSNSKDPHIRVVD
jgi:dethiobiotin synthetase